MREAPTKLVVHLKLHFRLLASTAKCIPRIRVNERNMVENDFTILKTIWPCLVY